MELCEVNNIINFYTDFSVGTCYYPWQVMAKAFRSDTFDKTEKEISSFWRCFMLVPILNQV
jgi:hypothetical protein